MGSRAHCTPLLDAKQRMVESPRYATATDTVVCGSTGNPVTHARAEAALAGIPEQACTSEQSTTGQLLMHSEIHMQGQRSTGRCPKPERPFHELILLQLRKGPETWG